MAPDLDQDFRPPPWRFPAGRVAEGCRGPEDHRPDRRCYPGLVGYRSHPPPQAPAPKPSGPPAPAAPSPPVAGEYLAG